MIQKIVQQQINYATIIVMLFIFLVGFFSFFALQIEQDPSFSALIASDSEFNTNERILANTLGSNDAFILFFKPDDESRLINRPTSMREQVVVEHIEDAKKILLESPYITRVIGPQFSDDNQYAQIVLIVDTPRTTDGFQTVITDVEYYVEQVGVLAGVKSTLTGFPLLLNRVNTLLIEDNLKTILFTFAAIFFVLLWYFRNLALTLVALTIPTSSLIILAGLMALLNVPITITLAAVGILVLGLGISFTIHVIIGFEKFLNQGLRYDKAIIEAMDTLHVAIIASYITTVAGFGALMFGISPSSQSQGLVLSMAITIIFLVTMIVLPALLSLFARTHKPSTVPIFETVKEQLAKLAQYQAKIPKTVITIVGVITIFMLIGASQVGFSTGNDNWIPDDDPIQETFRESSYAFGDDFSTIRVVIESTRGDLRSISSVRGMQDLAKIIESHPDIESVTTPFDGVSLDAQSIFVASQNASDRFNKDFTLTTITISVISFETSDEGSSRILTEIREMIYEHPIPDTKTSLFGDTIRFEELGTSLQQDTGVTTIISFVLVFLIASLTYYSLTVGLMAIFPILLAIIWAVGLMGFTGVPFTALSTGLIALVLGIGIDFSIHLVNSSFNYLKRGFSIDEALKRTLTYSGGALLLTTITTFIGFISLTLATLLGIQRLGLSLAFSILAVFLVSVMLVPAIISLGFKNNFKKVKKKKKK